MSGAPTKADYVEALKRERDRFVALAFCAADVLFEVDETRKITYAAGATKALTGVEPQESIGREFIDLIEPGERGYVSERLSHLGGANRLEPMILRLQGPTGPTPRRCATAAARAPLPRAHRPRGRPWAAAYAAARTSARRTTSSGAGDAAAADSAARTRSPH